VDQQRRLSDLSFRSGILHPSRRQQYILRHRFVHELIVKLLWNARRRQPFYDTFKRVLHHVGRYWLTLNQGNAFSTTSANYLLGTKGYLTSAVTSLAATYPLLTTGSTGAITISRLFLHRRSRLHPRSLAASPKWEAEDRSVVRLHPAPKQAASRRRDWTTFNNKHTLLHLDAFRIIPLTGSFIQVGSGGTLGIQAASASQNGYESSGDIP